MKTTFKFLSTLLLIVSINALLTSCGDEPDPAEREHDSNLIGEWIEYGGKFKYIADYYYFYSDGTCLHGNYERDIDWVDEDDEYEWYTVDNKYLYIDGEVYQLDRGQIVPEEKILETAEEFMKEMKLPGCIGWEKL